MCSRSCATVIYSNSLCCSPGYSGPIDALIYRYISVNHLTTLLSHRVGHRRSHLYSALIDSTRNGSTRSMHPTSILSAFDAWLRHSLGLHGRWATRITWAALDVFHDILLHARFFLRYIGHSLRTSSHSLTIPRLTAGFGSAIVAVFIPPSSMACWSHCRLLCPRSPRRPGSARMHTDRWSRFLFIPSSAYIFPDSYLAPSILHQV